MPKVKHNIVPMRQLDNGDFRPCTEDGCEELSTEADVCKWMKAHEITDTIHPMRPVGKKPQKLIKRTVLGFE